MTSKSGSDRPGPAHHPFPQGHRWWVRYQGREKTIVESDGMPNTKHEEGEAFIKLQGPFASREKAQEVLDRVLGKREAVNARKGVR